jgi:hypothetical protein
MRVLKFPTRSAAKVASTGAGAYAVWKGRAKGWFCRLLNRLGVPGAVQETAIEDGLTGQSIHVHVGVLFTRISVNGRDFYFHRLSGRLDGTGSGCR